MYNIICYCALLCVFCSKRRRFKWRGLEEREVVARGFGIIIGEIRTLLEEVRLRFTGGVCAGFSK